MEIKFLKHAECPLELLEKIASLKRQYWDYPVAEQLRWLKTNLLPRDVHVVIEDKSIVVAYLTVVGMDVYCDKRKMSTYGIGSVCVDENYRGMNYGFLIMQLGTFYIKKKKSLGFLLCRDELLPFYHICNWHLSTASFVVPGLKHRCNLYTSETVNYSEIVFPRLF